MDLHDWTTDASRAKFTFACTASGVAAKCARNWGYKPWKTVTESVWNGSAFVDQSYSLAPFYDACVIAARADYCQDGQSFTKNGTLVDLFDTLDGFTSINATVGLPYAPYAPGIMMHEEYQISVAGHVRDVLSDAQFMSLSPADQQLVLNLHRSGMESSRYPDLDPGRSCAAAPYVDRCDPKEPYACYRATNMSTVPYGPFLAVNSPRHCSHDEATQGEALDPLCNECVNRICNVDPTCCADPGTGFYPGSLVWDGRCRAIGDQVCRSVPGEGAVNRWPLGNPPPPATGGAKTFLSGALGSFEGIVSQGGGADGGAGSAALFAEGWSCDPDFPASANPVQISVGGALGDSGATLFTTVANLPLAPAWRDTVNDACGGAGRHGFRFALPAGSEGKDIYVYGIDLNVPGAPFSLLRGGKKTAPGGSDPLPAPRAAIWTGWVEPGTSGNYTFTASAGSTDKYRVWVNGTYLAGNWIDPDPTVPGAFTLPAPTTPPVQFLQKGVRYGVRIEYLRTASLPADSAFSLLWSLNGAAAQSIPTSALHPVGQGNGNGLEGSFFAGDFSGSTLPATTALPQTIGVVDQVWTDGIPPTTGLTVNQTFAARFAGQVVPPISGDYTFTADTDGNARIWVNGVLVTDADASKAPPGLDKDTCNHDICRTGEAVSRTCKQGFFCASQICLTDPSCCSITWDAHCVQQVADVCQLNCSPTPPVPITLSAGVKYDIRVEYQHVGGDPTPPAITVRGAHLRLMWALPGGPRDVIPVERLFASTAAPATTSGVGINAAFFSDADFKVEYLDRVQASLGFAAASPPDGSLPGTLIDGNPGPVAGPAAPSLGLDHLSGQVATLRGGGAAPGAVVKIFEGSTQLGGDLAIAADGSDGGTFTVNVTLALGAHTLTAIQYVSSVASPPAEPLLVTVPGLPPAPTVVGSTDILSGSAQVSVNGTGTPGATIKVKVGATTYTATVAADTNGDGLGVWTLTVLNLAPGAYDLSFTQTTPDGTSDTGASVKVKVPLPALVVNQPADGASITNQLTVSGTAASTFGDVVVGDGDGRFFAERATVPVSASSGAFAGPTPGVALDYGRHQLKIFQRANGLDGDGVLRTVLVKPPLGALAITALVSGGVETVLPGVPTLDTDVIVNGTGGLPRTGPNGTGMPGRVVVYRGLTATDPAPVKIGEATLADDGSFSVSVRLIGAGSRYLSVSQVASSLSGGGTAESDARTTPVHVLVRPGPPTITQTSTDPAPNDLRLTVTGTVPQVGAQTVTITADGGTPARTVSVNANVQSNGTFTGILQLPLSGTYSVTAFQTADTASGPASQPPVLVVAGDVTAPDVTDAGGNPVVVPAVSAASADGAIVNFSSLVYSADNGSAPAHCLPATAPALNCVCLPASGSTFALGTTTVTCAATDAAGNTGTTTFPVTVKSTIPPDIAVSNVTAEAQGPEGAVVSYQVSASGFIVDCAEPGSGEVRPCMSWKPAHTGLGFTPQAAAVNPIDGTVYAGFFGRFSEADAAGASHLFKLPPGATDWVALTGPSTGPIRQIVLGHGATPRLYLPADPTGGTAANQGVWISGDGGDSWSLALSGLSIAGVAIDPGATAQDHLLAWTNVAGGGLGGRTSPAGLYESFDGGITWAGAGAGLPLVQILSVALDPSQPGRMYASVLPDSAEIVKTKVFRRKDAGAWQRLSIPALSPITNPVNTTIARSLWVAPAVPACTPPSQCQTFPTLFAGRWMSRDGGETFSRNLFGFDFAAMVFDRVLDAANPGRIIFAAGSINNLFKSIDYGKTWSPTSFFAAPIVQGGSFAQDHFDGNRLYAASSLGLFRSVLTSTQQLNWVPMASPGLSLPGVNIKDLAVDPINPSVAYAVSEFGLFKTQDSGNSWAASNLGLDDPFAFQGLGQVLVDRFDRNTVYLGSRMGLSDATWKSPNAGVNWTALQHTACPGDGDSCFPGGASLQQASGRLTLDPLVRGNWISVSETSASNFSYRLQDSDLGPIRGTLLINPTDTSGWVAGISSPFAYRGLLVPGVERSLLVSFATLGGFGLGGAAQSNGGLDFIHYDGSLVPAAGGAAFQQGKWAGLGTSNVVLDGSDGTNRLYVSGSAIGQDASKLYRATVATVRDNPPASVVWEQLGGGTAFAQTQFTTLLIDPASGGQRMYTIGRRTGAADPGDALWESHDGGRNWQMDDTAPPYLSRLWVSAADGALFATITPAALDTTGLYYSASRNDPSIEKPGGVLWRRELTQDTETKPGARVVRADLRVSCDYPSTVPANDPRRQRAIGAGATFPVGPTTLHCTATDVFGNSSTNDITITVTDTTPPAITTPSSLASTAPSGGTVPVAFTVTAADAVDGPITPTCVPASGSAFAIGATTVQCSATDAHGNSARAAFPVIVSQSSAPALTPPTLTTPGDLAVEATGPNPNAATVTLPVSGATAGGAALTPTCTAATTDGTAVALAGTPPAGTFSFGITNVTCSVTDTGTTPPLTVTRVFRVTVKDTTAPHIVAPTQLAAPFGSPVSFTVTATDAVTSPVTPSCSPSSPASFPLGKTIVNCQAADAAGNQAFAKITVTVTDQNPPVLHLADMTVDADDALGARTSYVPAPGFAHFATDVEDQTQGLLPAVTCVPAALPPPDGPGGGLWFPMGDTQVSCTAVDAGNNQAHGSFFVHVVDRSPPTVTVPAPITAEATGPDGASVGFPSSAFDLVDSTVTVACDRATGIGAAKPVTSGAVFPLGESTVTCRATDHAGNTGAASFAVVVHDTTAPSLTLPTPAVPGDPALIFEASPDTGTAALNFRTTGTGNDVVKATDAVACPEGDATLKCTVACTPRVGSQLLPGLTTVNCVVRDAAGNESQGSFTVRVHGRGGVCTTGADCGSGFCVDGVCCASACGGGDPTDCQACSVAAGGTTDGLCTPVSAAHVCRPSAGVCDAAETCDGSSLQCPANGFAPAGTGCRASAGVCDTAEVCTGSSAQCPADQLTAAGTICRAGAGACDVAEVCSGSSAACPPDALLSAGSVCRASAGACDVAETCSGSSATCPPDALRTAGTTCRASAGACDVAETCSGSSAACPPDALKAAGTTCRASAGACDVAEACSGSAATCPPDSFVAAGTTCRASAGACDVAEVCSGSAATCPVDSLVAAGTTCRASAGTCDVAEACSGSSAACPPDALKAAGTTCRASAGTCDVAETCSGSAATCPPDSFVAAGTVCAPASNSCQTPGKCSGGGPVCPGVTPIPGCSTDTTPPVFTNVPGTIVAFATTTAGAKVSYTKPTATDAVDGVRPVTCTPASDSTFQPGKTTVSCTAADKSGNSKTVTFTIWVQYQAPTDGTFFLAPIRANGSSIFRIGRPVPVRFRLTGASAGITNLVAKLIVTKISNTVSGTTIDTSDEDTDDTDFIFKFRSGLKIYAYRWKTSNQTQGTYQLKADLGDGVVHQVNVSLKSGW